MQSCETLAFKCFLFLMWSARRVHWNSHGGVKTQPASHQETSIAVPGCIFFDLLFSTLIFDQGHSSSIFVFEHRRIKTANLLLLTRAWQSIEDAFTDVWAFVRPSGRCGTDPCQQICWLKSSWERRLLGGGWWMDHQLADGAGLLQLQVLVMK